MKAPAILLLITINTNIESKQENAIRTIYTEKNNHTVKSKRVSIEQSREGWLSPQRSHVISEKINLLIKT